MSTTGASADGTASATGASASAAIEFGGASVGGTFSASGASAASSVAGIIGSTPSTEGQPVLFFTDSTGDPFAIDPAADPFLVQAGVTWTGKSASEAV
jgi:hypothetical protein